MSRRTKKSEVDYPFLLGSFFIWRALLLVLVFFAVRLLPLQENYLGGGMSLYKGAPWFWSWGNFDGEHYLSIARDGYTNLRYFFFPVYPLLIKIFTLGSRTLHSFFSSGLFVSHTAFLLGVIGFWKLLALDLNRKNIKKVLIFLLLFPTSYYFGSIYTEGTFFALAIWSFYFARQKNFLAAGILGMVASATRPIGIILFPALLAEYAISQKVISKNLKFNWKKMALALPLFLIPVGLFSYMYFLEIRTGDPLAFFTSLNEVFGEQRSGQLILLPQVFYRYIFKILPNLNYSYLPSVFTGWLEFLVAGLFLALSALSFFKLRLSYALFLTLGYLAPTFSGSFSSLPRYALVLFPAYILISQYNQKLPKLLQQIIVTMLFISLGLATALFARGYWVS